MTDAEVHDVLVIGAGIIGISSALALQKAGRKILVLDRPSETRRASDMNAGAFAFTDIVPLATPGIMRKAPKWLLDPLGPLSVPPAYALQIAPWMLRFWRASWPDRYQASLSAQAYLMQVSQAALDRQTGDVGGADLFQRDGQMQLYEGDREFRASLPGWDLRKQHGIRFEFLESPDAIAAVQPGLDRRFTHAAYTPDWINTCDPARWLAHLTSTFTARNGRIGEADVVALRPGENTVCVETRSGSYKAKQVVVAAGAWSHNLAHDLGDRIPLETERGYNTTLPAGAFELKTHLTFSGHGFVVTRINGGVRVGGAVELGGLNLKPNYKRADILLNKAKRFLPGLKSDGGSQWMGFRPSLPDSLPVIDRSPKDRRIIYAFGHGHLGLTQSAGTAELVAHLAGETPAPIDMSAFSARRF
ncbi:FAD-binding oxidoreductase [Labrenzia sp. VG12]|uniref:NAD(P)/FAD-dependent oxidoreductase n=1 Tax=Labrenzia sp. VG12 TaxID=2021862 RepID=UPI000B8C230C|nr:FAD-binding oxidoreductase [Labrenzia sp. VG12]ASP34708.1 amino acid dehydrogenase [Labrenzia sp. VG12]